MSPAALPAQRYLASIAALTLLGFGLRLAAARGDLWLDEIWSLTLVERSQSFLDIVVALPHDNNHVLNSLWLKLVGPSTSPLLIRAPAILFGSASIPLAARLGARISRQAGLIFAACIAVDVVPVTFGSEARGYAGLLFFTLLALDAGETYAATRDPKRLLVLAFAVCLGTFSHLMMAEATGLVAAATWGRLVLDRRTRAHWQQDALRLVAAAMAGSLPPFLCLAASVASGPMHMGLGTPFTWTTLSEGLGGMARFTLGFWSEPLPRALSGMILTFLALAIIALLRVLPPERRIVPALGLVGLPLLHALAHLPSQLYARFHLVSGLCLLLFVAELLARGLARGGVARHIALLMTAAFVIGEGLMLARLLDVQRGAFQSATHRITAGGPVRIAALPGVAAPETAAVIRWYARRNGWPAAVTLVAADQICVEPPRWLIIVHRPDDARDETDAQQLAALPCADRFAPAITYPGYGMSGFTWSLFADRPASAR